VTTPSRCPFHNGLPPPGARGSGLQVRYRLAADNREEITLYRPVGAQAVRSSVVDQIGLSGGVDGCRPRREIVCRDPDQAGPLVVVVVRPPTAPKPVCG